MPNTGIKIIRVCIILGMVAALLPHDKVWPKQDRDEREFTVHLKEASEAKVSLIPYEAGKAAYSKPIEEIPDVKKGESAVVKVPGRLLPGEFVLRLDYRMKKTGKLYPAERIIFINEQDIEITVNPPYINNDQRTKFNQGEKENTVYSEFMKENSQRRMSLNLLRQLLLNYDLPDSDFYTEAVREFEERRQDYNQWLKDQAKKYSGLYVSRLFQFQHIPKTLWTGSEEDRLNSMLENYFEGIDLNDPLITRSRELRRFLDEYMRLYGMQAASEEERNSLFTQAGRIACEKASKGHPKVYGWMVDYFYTGYLRYNIKQGMAMLKEHINNPNCPASKKEQITKYLADQQRLAPGALSPNFTILDSQGNNFEFHKYRPEQKYKLLLFLSSTCGACQRLSGRLKQWYDNPANKEKVDIVIVGIGLISKEKLERINSLGWKYLPAKQGATISVARDYSVSGVPTMFLIESKSNIIVSAPGSFKELVENLESID